MEYPAPAIAAVDVAEPDAMITLAGTPITSLDLTDGLDAAWIADVELATDTAPRGAVTLSDGTRQLQGTVLRAGELAGLVRARIVGGRGGLRQVVPPTSHRQARVREVLRSLLTSAGEALSPSSDAALLERLLPHWTRARGTSAAALSILAEHLGASWRVIDDGSVWVGRVMARRVDSTALVLDEFHDRGWKWAAVDRLDLFPGAQVDSDVVRQVQYVIDEGHLRARYWWFG